jgi:predicted aldo/keto reductase-like oxidoreductase
MMNNYFGQDFKKLGFGLMRPPFISENGDVEQMKEMVDLYLEKGFSYFDTSYFYGQGISETHARQVIVERHPRSSFQFATKLPLWVVEKKEDMEQCLHTSLKRSGLDYIDFYMLHGLSAAKSDRFPGSYLDKADRFGAWEFLNNAKAAGKVRHIGFSFHDSAELLDRLLTDHPEVEFVQLQINYADWEDSVIQSRKCYETAMKHKKPVIIMEPLKGGTLLKLRPEAERIFKTANPEASIASWAIRYCASLSGVITVLSGMQSVDVVKDNISYMENFKPLTPAEQAVVGKVVNELRNVDAIKCTGCGYCLDNCPQKIRIPSVFEYLNDYRMYKDIAYAKRRYGNSIQESGKASDCVSCGSCESHCPQKLKIITYLQEAAELLEEKKEATK